MEGHSSFSFPYDAPSFKSAATAATADDTLVVGWACSWVRADVLVDDARRPCFSCCVCRGPGLATGFGLSPPALFCMSMLDLRPDLSPQSAAMISSSESCTCRPCIDVYRCRFRFIFWTSGLIMFILKYARTIMIIFPSIDMATHQKASDP